MPLKTFTYYDNKKKIEIKVRPCKTILSKFRGLMFRKTSPPLLFIFNKEKQLTIHSFFCKPFKAIWLDKEKRVTKTEIINKPKPYISGKGKYLLEITTRITPK